jgi:hypothetical protein
LLRVGRSFVRSIVSRRFKNGDTETIPILKGLGHQINWAFIEKIWA